MKRKWIVFLVSMFLLSTVAWSAPADLAIQVNTSTGDVFLTWSGGTADVHYIDVDYECSFDSASVSAGNSSPWTDPSASSAVRRFYRVSDPGSDSLTKTTVGKIDVDLRIGFNMVSVPFDLGYVPYASQIVADIAAQGGSVTELSRWNSTNGSWETYDPTFPIVDFLIYPGDGFFLKASAMSTWIMTGEVIRDSSFEISLATGYTQIGIPSADYMTASEAVNAIIAEGGDVSQLIWWDPMTGDWRTFEVIFPLDDFPLAMEKGYFIRMESGFAWVLDTESECGSWAGPVFFFAGGGGQITQGSNALRSVIGQALAGEVKSGSYSLKAGGAYIFTSNE